MTDSLPPPEPSLVLRGMQGSCGDLICFLSHAKPYPLRDLVAREGEGRARGSKGLTHAKHQCPGGIWLWSLPPSCNPLRDSIPCGNMAGRLSVSPTNPLRESIPRSTFPRELSSGLGSRVSRGRWGAREFPRDYAAGANQWPPSSSPGTLLWK